MTEVIVISGFTDKNEGVFRKVGDTFSCDDVRAKELAELKVVKITAEEAPAAKPAKKAAKKTTKKG